MTYLSNKVCSSNLSLPEKITVEYNLMVAISWISCLNNLRIARTVFASWMIADRKAAHSVLSSVLAGRLRPCMISRRRFLKTRIVTSSVAEISSLLPFRNWIKRTKMMDLICRSYINFNGNIPRLWVGHDGSSRGGREMEGVDQSFRGRSGGLRPIS